VNVIIPVVVVFPPEVWAKIIGVDIIVPIFRVTISGFNTIRHRVIINICNVFIYILLILFALY
jgi:hypothetical protein